jgi:hypothetical protein
VLAASTPTEGASPELLGLVLDLFSFAAKDLDEVADAKSFQLMELPRAQNKKLPIWVRPCVDSSCRVDESRSPSSAPDYMCSSFHFF